MRVCDSIRHRRRGAALVEAAIVLPVLFLLMFGLIVGAMGIFHYQQVAMLAREGARYASVRGGSYADETGQPAATAQSIFEEAIRPRAVTLDVDRLSHQVQWDHPSKMPVYLANPNSDPLIWRQNNVTVTVQYAWNPLLIFRPMTLRSTSVKPVTF